MWKAGTASRCVTPDEPLWLAGFAVRTEPSKGTVSELYAGALAMEDDQGGKLVIASIDTIAIPRHVAEPVARRVLEQIGLPCERLVLAATHTHYAPELRPDKAPFFHIPPKYAAKIDTTAQNVTDALVEVIVEAVHRLEPSKVYIEKTSAGFAHNRRRDGARGGNPSKEDTLDHDVPALWTRTENRDRPRTGIVFGYACHNSSIAPEDGRYCADWAGFAAEELKRMNPGATPLFISGCGADQNAEPRGSIELSQKHGHELAEAVQAVMARGGREIHGTIRVAMETVPLALQPVIPADMEAGLKSDDPPRRVKAKFLKDQMDRGEPFMTEYPARVQVVRLGDQALMILLGGEPVVDWAHAFKRQFADHAPLVWAAGYCNDMCGYIPTRRVQREGGYEGGRANLWSAVPAPWADDVEDRVWACVRRLVKKVSS